jgi:carboxylesterase
MSAAVSFSLPGDRLAPFDVGEGRVGALLSHGFSGAPYEMRELGLGLAERGYRVKGVRLAGHAEGDEAFVRSRWPDWWGTVERAYAELASQCDRVVFCGMSMGGLLGLKLAARAPLAALAIYDTPLYLTSAPLLGWRFLPHVLGTPRPSGLSVYDEAAFAALPAPGRPGPGNILSLYALMSQVRGLLPEVSCPLLLVYSRKDKLVPHTNLEYVAKRVGSRDVAKLLLERSGHVATLDSERGKVQATTAEFLARVAPCS